MEQIQKVGLSIEKTGEGTSRMMISIRLEGQFVAGLSFHTQKSHFEPEKKGFWVQFLKRPELSKKQIAAIIGYIDEQTTKYRSEIFGGQE